MHTDIEGHASAWDSFACKTADLASSIGKESSERHRLHIHLQQGSARHHLLCGNGLTVRQLDACLNK